MSAVKTHSSMNDYHDYARLFALRLLLCKQNMNEKLNEYLLFKYGLMEMVVPSMDLETVFEMGDTVLRGYLNEQLQALEARELEVSLISTQSSLGLNIGYLSTMLRLESVASRLLEFLWLVKKNREFDVLLGGLLDKGLKVEALLSIALKMRSRDVAAVIAKGAPLVSVRLIVLKDAPWSKEWSEHIKIPDFLVEVLAGDFKTADAFYAEFLRGSRPGELSREDFPHLAKDFRVLLPFLKNTVTSRTRGVNVLIYGPPGTGKSQLVRVLSAELDFQLYEVPYENKKGEAIGANGRLSANMLAQQFLKNIGNSLLMFDEADNAFPTMADTCEGMFQRESDQCKTSKAWFNALLENNPVPTLWITNHIYSIDEAFLRRFDYVMEVGTPPRSIRRRIAEKHLGNLAVGETLLDCLAESPQLSPALLEKTKRVLALSGVSDPQEAEAVVRRVVDNRLRLAGSDLNDMRYRTNTTFNPAFINAKADMAEITEAVRRHPSLKICLYGPPGTGKTAYGHYLAEQLDRPVILKTASDLLSMWVGGTEQAIAAMFRQATEEGAVLILDEADSFLRDRTTAQRSWEITQVNELLVRMERFQGVFVCCTNLMDSLDQASLRRFTVKAQFGYLRPEQSLRLYIQEFGESLTTPDDTRRIQQRLAALNNLTPGDFATVKRQRVLWGDQSTPDRILSALEDECKSKPGAAMRIGFI